MLDVFCPRLGWAWWWSATRLRSWGSSAWDPGFDRDTDLGCSLGALVCPFLGRLVLCGAEEGKAGHLVGKVLCAGGLVGVDSTGDTGDLWLSGLGGEDSFLWVDAQDEPLGNREALFPCRALEMRPSGSPQDLLVLPWKEKTRHVSATTKLVAQLMTTFLSLPAVWRGHRLDLANGMWIAMMHTLKRKKGTLSSSLLSVGC